MDPYLNINLNSSESEIVRKSKEVDPELVDRYIYNRAVDEPAYTILIIMYSILISVGALGNALVILSVVRKPAMRTPRNLFIVNLAVSDLLLCTVTMPLTLMEILTKHWPLGNHSFICRMIGALQATSIFVSTISITAIALDRYQVIVYPTKENLQLFGAAIILLIIWMIAMVLASPIFIYKRLAHHDFKLNGTELDGLNFCIEDWPIAHGRAYYSIFSLVVQYILPIIIVSVAYLRIYFKLRYRFAAGFVSKEDTSQNSRRQLRGRKLQRTNLLLVSIAVIFCISWLPLNLYNLIADIWSSMDFTSQPMKVCYAICHMMGMSSACSNPVLYGWLNENFWKEFKDIMCISGSTRSNSNSAECRRLTGRKASQKSIGRGKPDLVTVATDFHQGATVATEMSVLTRC
ncbi:hypothetical protein RI129_006111 [Pyrocoelia pectoralis]|uniref:G-protein coupled receptors family 1 profile domain-containing protein n=1 Tax=Pyrocoelia pectoralis TaxID=417401 RepID=A0AAN7ZP74_9COLE